MRFYGHLIDSNAATPTFPDPIPLPRLADAVSLIQRQSSSKKYADNNEEVVGSQEDFVSCWILLF